MGDGAISCSFPSLRLVRSFPVLLGAFLGDKSKCRIWHHRPTPVPPAALKMPSRLGVMRDVQYSPTEADPPISIALTL